jgi:hypothetical protein
MSETLISEANLVAEDVKTSAVLKEQAHFVDPTPDGCAFRYARDTFCYRNVVN